MNHQVLAFIIFMAIVSAFPALASPESTIPKGGTVFIGEQDLDITQCNVHSGDEIGWWESGNPQGVPTARARVGDTSRFSVTPDTFKGHTGIWYDMAGQKPVFTVEDPSLQLEVVENGLGDNKDWVKRGNMVSFKITTNMNTMNKRPGCPGVTVSISMKGPNGTAPKTLVSSKNTEFDLNNIYVYSSPYDTGASWDTSDTTKYPDGKYTFSAKTNTNHIYDNYEESGKTYTDEQTITLSQTKNKDESGDVATKKSSNQSETVAATSVKSSSSTKVTVEPTDEPTKKPTTEETVSKTSKSSSSSSADDEATVKPTKKPTTEETVSKTSKSSSSSSANDEVTAEPTKKTSEDTPKKETVTGIASFGGDTEMTSTSSTNATKSSGKTTSSATLSASPVPTTVAPMDLETTEPSHTTATAKPAGNKSAYPHPPKSTPKPQPFSPVLVLCAILGIAAVARYKRY